MWCVEVLDGPYEGLIYQYDTIRLVDAQGNLVEEDAEVDDTYISFNTITISNPKKVEQTDELSHEIFGEILNELVKTEFERMTLVDETNESELIDSQKLDTQ